VAAGRFAPDPVAVEAQRAADGSLDHETPLSEVFEDQVCCADIVLLTKADLAGEQGLDAARRAIAAEVPRPVPMLAVTDGAIDPRLILGLHAAAEDDIAARPSHHDGEDEHEHDDFASVVIELPETDDVDALVDAIRDLARRHNVLRAKGYIAVSGKPMRLLVQSVGERVRHQFDQPWGARPRRSKLVVIGERGDIDEAAITQAFARSRIEVLASGV
jgi:cobalamin biosynthesis protein CobW